MQTSKASFREFGCRTNTVLEREKKKKKRKGAQQVMKFITAKLVPSGMRKSKTMGKKAKTKGRQ